MPMARWTLVKLLVLILLTFIICLSEFLPSEKVSQIMLHCSPFEPCDPPSGRDHLDGQVYTVLDFVGESYALCGVEPKNATNQIEAIKGWFVCETESDLDGLRGNASISEIDVEVILMLQTIDLAYQNFTVYGHFNYSGLHIETQHITLLNCCDQFQHQKLKNPHATANGSDPDVFTSEPTHMKQERKDFETLNPRQSNRSHCVLQMREVPKAPNNTVSRWRSSAIVWLVLVLVVIGLILLSTVVQIRCCQKKSVVVPVPAYQPKGFSKHRAKSLGDLPDSMSMFETQDKKTFQQKTLQKNRSRDQFLQVFQETYRRGLSPIQEISLTDVAVDEANDQNDDVITAKECDLSLDMPLTPVHIHSDTFTFLHHRSHPSTVDSTTKSMS